MNASRLDILNAITACLGFALASASLIWQAITWRLAGGIARADLYFGAIDDSGVAYVTLPAKSSLVDVDILRGDGFNRKLIVVTVRNTGRLPITVQSWNLEFARKYR